MNKMVQVIIVFILIVFISGCSFNFNKKDSVSIDDQSTNMVQDDRDEAEATNKNPNNGDGLGTKVGIGKAGVREDYSVTEEEFNTSTWKTYINEEYGFSFRYPKNWEIEITKRSYYRDVPEFLTEVHVSQPPEPDIFNFYIPTLTFSVTEDNLDTIVSEIEGGGMIIEGQSLSAVGPIVDTKIGDFHAKTGSHSSVMGTKQDFYYIPKDEYSLYIHCLDTGFEDFEIVFKRIIESLEFAK